MLKDFVGFKSLSVGGPLLERRLENGLGDKSGCVFLLEIGHLLERIR